MLRVLQFLGILHIPEWLLGVLLGIGGCLGIAFGMTLLKWTHMVLERRQILHEHDPDNHPAPSSYYWHPIWWAGLILILTASGPLDMAALALVPQSVFAPLSGLTLCLNAVISPWLLGENLADADAAATALVVIGAGLTTVFGDHKKQDFTVDQLVAIMSKDQVMVWLSCTWMVMALLLMMLKTTWFRKHYLNNKGARVGPLVYGVIAGIAGAQQFLFLKASVEIVKHAIEHGAVAFSHWSSYAFVVIAVVCALLQIRYLNEGLALYDNVIFLPMYNTWLIMIGVANGGIVYTEFANAAHGKKFVYFFLGMGLALTGISMLTLRPGASSEEPEEEDERTRLIRRAAEEKEESARAWCNCMRSSLPPLPDPDELASTAASAAGAARDKGLEEGTGRRGSIGEDLDEDMSSMAGASSGAIRRQGRRGTGRPSN